MIIKVRGDEVYIIIRGVESSRENLIMFGMEFDKSFCEQLEAILHIIFMRRESELTKVIKLFGII